MFESERRAIKQAGEQGNKSREAEQAVAAQLTRAREVSPSRPTTSFLELAAVSTVTDQQSATNVPPLLSSVSTAIPNRDPGTRHTHSVDPGILKFQLVPLQSVVCVSVPSYPCRSLHC